MALKGIQVVEMLGLAPGPFCGKILADFGATVTVIQKLEGSPFDVMANGKKIISVNLKSSEGVTIVKQICSKADVLLDTFRPGVMERIGLGPDVLEKVNDRLIYARLSGYGQTGFYKDKGGHDINYTAMSGILSLLGRNKQPPNPPLNLLADFGGGSFTCVIGILLALFERNLSGKGQIVDVSMTEGAAYLGSWVFKSRNLPIWFGEPGTNVLDGGFPFYGTYKTKDEKFMAVGALEPQFYLEFLKGLQLSPKDYSQMGDVNVNREKFQEIFLTKTQEEWIEVFEKLDACVTPVLNLNQVATHKCNKSRDAFTLNEENNAIPAPSPRLSRTPGISVEKLPIPSKGEHSVEILKDLNYDEYKINELIKNGHVYSNIKSKI